MRCELNAGHLMKAAVRLSIVGACLCRSAPLSAQEPKPRATLEGHTEAVASLSFTSGLKKVAGTD